MGSALNISGGTPKPRHRATPNGTPSVGGRGTALMEQVAVLGDGTETATMNGTVLDPNRETLRPKLFIFNLAMTVAIMVLLILDLVPLSYLFMVGTAVALLVNFPKISDQAKMISSHASSVIAVVSMVLAAAVLTGVLSGTGMVEAMSAWLVDVIPASMGPFLAVLTGVISIPVTFFMTNDAFYFGILPVLTEAGAHYGITRWRWPAPRSPASRCTCRPRWFRPSCCWSRWPASTWAITTRRCCGAHSWSPW